MTLVNTSTFLDILTTKGTSPLPKQAGMRSMALATWLARSARVEFVATNGNARETTAACLHWCPVGLLVKLAGAKCLLAWKRAVMCELIED